MAEKLIVSSSPHRRTRTLTKNIMLQVLIALLPSVIAATILFGLRALIVVALSAAGAMLSEYVFNLVLKKKQTVSDLSAIVTGVILALNLPSGIPYYIVLIGDIFAIIIVKCLFGGLGRNFANPAMTARIALLISFPGAMSEFTIPFADTIASATPLASEKSYSYIDLLLGKIPGSMGEVCAIAILIGFIYLLIRRVISPIIPLSFVGSAMILTLLLGADPVYSVLSGGLLFGAVFMATAYVTSPIKPLGKLIFGIGCGVITVVIRIFGSYPEGVSCAILLMNIIVPLIDRIPSKAPFGVKGGKK